MNSGQVLRRLVWLTVFLAAVIPLRAYDFDPELKRPFEGRQLTPIEGLWLWNTGAVVSIQADARGAITLTLVGTPDPYIETPVIIGTGAFSGSQDSYNIELKTSGQLKAHDNKGKRARFMARIQDGDRLSLTPYSTGIHVNVWRLVPYLFRFSVGKKDAPAGLDGAVRIWPGNGNPLFPVVL